MYSNSICFQRIELCQIGIGNGCQNIDVFDCGGWCECWIEFVARVTINSNSIRFRNIGR